ncbi:MAG: YciI family protein [Myxococcales bacterium]|nr:YciI family protein [Myxococcales bacterium]
MSVQYAILIYESPDDQRIREEDQSEQREVRAAYQAYTEALVAAGRLRGGEVLDLPHTATTLVAKPGAEPVIHDGPYADTLEQLAGFYLIEAEHLDEALDWARRCPAAATGRVEIRPILARP